MGAITDPSEIDNAQRQIGQPTPSVPEMAQTAGAIVDPAELAHARAQLAAPAAGNASPSPVAALPASSPAALPQGPTFMGPRPDRGIGGRIEDAIRMTIAPLLGDRAAAALDTVSGTGLPNANYAKNLANEQAQTQWAQSEHPIASRVLGGAGSLAGAGAIAATLPEDIGLGAAALGGRAIGSAITGGGISGVNAASAEPDLTAPGVPGRVGTATALGAGLGGVAPIAGVGLGSAYTGTMNAVNGGAEGVSRAASRPLVRALAADDPSAVSARMQNLGPLAMLADAGPAMRETAQAVAIENPEGLSTVERNLTARNAGTNQRLQSDINTALGPAASPLAVTNALKAVRGQIHQSALPPLFASAPPVDVTPILADIGQGIVKARGGQRAVLQQAGDDLMQDGVDSAGNATRVPVTDAETINNAKIALDKLIDFGNDSLGVKAGSVSKSEGAAGGVYRQINQALRDQVPGYGDVMDASSAIARQIEAIERGDTILAGGKSATRPEDLTSNLSDLASRGLGPQSPIVNELQGMRVGARGSIDRTMGTKANDLVALRNEMQGEGGWNAANMGTIFGQGPASDVLDSIDRNSAFRDTANSILSGAKTAKATAMRESLQNDMAGQTRAPPLIDPRNTFVGMATAVPKRILSWTYGQMRPEPTRGYGEMGNILTSQGPQRDVYLRSLADALSRRNANAAMGERVGNASSRAALAAALLGRSAFAPSQNSP